MLLCRASDEHSRRTSGIKHDILAHREDGYRGWPYYISHRNGYTLKCDHIDFYYQGHHFHKHLPTLLLHLKFFSIDFKLEP